MKHFHTIFFFYTVEIAWSIFCLFVQTDSLRFYSSTYYATQYLQKWHPLCWTEILENVLFSPGACRSRTVGPCLEELWHELMMKRLIHAADSDRKRSPCNTVESKLCPSFPFIFYSCNGIGALTAHGDWHALLWFLLNLWASCLQNKSGL